MDTGAVIEADIGAIQTGAGMAYNDVALDNAHAQGLTSVQVAIMGYYEIAALAEVVIDENGAHPDDPDFIYRNVRAFVVGALQAEEEAAVKVEEEKKLEAFLALNSKDSTLGKMKVYRNEDGDIVIK